MAYAQINFLHQKTKKEDINLIQNILNICFKEEKLENKELYFNIVLTNSKTIKIMNKKYRNIDKETDVLSFPMFERKELKKVFKEQDKKIPYIIGDIIISIEKVIIQAEEYGNGFKRELSYMIVHGFYHLLGYDHEKEEDKEKMRSKEEKILSKLKILK